MRPPKKCIGSIPICRVLFRFPARFPTHLRQWHGCPTHLRWPKHLLLNRSFGSLGVASAQRTKRCFLESFESLRKTYCSQAEERRVPQPYCLLLKQLYQQGSGHSDREGVPVLPPSLLCGWLVRSSICIYVRFLSPRRVRYFLHALGRSPILLKWGAQRVGYYRKMVSQAVRAHTEKRKAAIAAMVKYWDTEEVMHSPIQPPTSTYYHTHTRAIPFISVYPSLNGCVLFVYGLLFCLFGLCFPVRV